MAACPTCGRPMAIAGPRCLYCGGLVSDLEVSKPQAPLTRVLLVVAFAGVNSSTLGRALGLSPFDAEQRTRRKGFGLIGVKEDAEARAEALRLGREGLDVTEIPEAEVRKALDPIRVRGGIPEGGSLRVRAEEGWLELKPSDVLLFVGGPITRQRQASEEMKKIEGGPIAPGERVHIHRLVDVPPVEVDPQDFECGPNPITGSTFLEVRKWLKELQPGASWDDQFRHEAPVFSPEGAPREAGRERPLIFDNLPLPQERRREGALILDNLKQFRFYSAWRGILERKRLAS